jgi:hypothetical protein
MKLRTGLIAAIGFAAALAGCKSQGEIVVDRGVGITALRTTCPAVGVPDYTGDITLFRGNARTADAIDVVAAMTNLRSSCDDSSSRVYSEARFDVYATRTDTRGARTVEIPFYSVVLRGGSAVVSKRVGTVSVSFADGQSRATGSGTAGAFIDRNEATLAPDIVAQINQRRRAGDESAAVDPLTLPEVRAALARANFELLVGFQLTEAQLAYNATR